MEDTAMHLALEMIHESHKSLINVHHKVNELEQENGLIKTTLANLSIQVKEHEATDTTNLEHYQQVCKELHEAKDEIEIVTETKVLAAAAQIEALKREVNEAQKIGDDFADQVVSKCTIIDHLNAERTEMTESLADAADSFSKMESKLMHNLDEMNKSYGNLRHELFTAEKETESLRDNKKANETLLQNARAYLSSRNYSSGFINDVFAGKVPTDAVVYGGSESNHEV